MYYIFAYQTPNCALVSFNNIARHEPSTPTLYDLCVDPGRSIVPCLSGALWCNTRIITTDALVHPLTHTRHLIVYLRIDISSIYRLHVEL